MEKSPSAKTTILIGGLLIGILDAIDAIIFFGIHSHSTPIRIFQSIASAILSHSAFQMGFRSVIVGIALHFTVAFSIAAVLWLIARVIPGLLRYPVPGGILYGLAAFTVMNFVILPLIGTSTRAPHGAVLWNGLFIHAFGIGLPLALLAARSRRFTSI